jgi:hypothetical protein
MKLHLIAACLAAGSTLSFAFADQTTASNPKTAQKPYSSPSARAVHGAQSIQASKTALPNPSNEQDSAAQMPGSPEQKALRLLQLKRAAQAQSNPAPLSQGAQQGNPQGLPGTLALGGSDSCATPDLIAGNGAFAFDNTAATTGTQGQTEGLCSFYTMTAITRDVWFLWTAPSTGTATFSLCYGTTMDSKIAVYAGAGCPGAGTAIACNDDSCSFQSQVSFAVSGGSSYLLQLGNFPGAPGAAGVFLMQVVVPAANDDCNTAQLISGTGVFSFDNSLATTGIDGQSEALCAVQWGQTTVDNDVWFRWTAPSSGVARVSTCGLTSVDTKIAAYAGSGCPSAGSALACNDDSCQSFQTSILFPATGGSTYTIQMGTFPGASGGTGHFTLDVLTPPPNDDCATPTVLSGLGVFPFDNSVATTGTQGQSESLCAAQYGQTQVESDVWFSWTAPTSGIALVDTCGLTTVDTKIAMYAGSGCPAAGTALACSDDNFSCYPQTTLAVTVTAGSTYTIQLGTYPGAGGGPGSVSIIIIQPAPNDDCSTAVVISGAGTFPFDTNGTTTGPQQGLNCGTGTCYNDVWYSWTAPASGICVYTLCNGGAFFDTLIVAYAGSGCPSGSALTCNDDSCGLVSQCTFNVTAGSSYMLQLGSYYGGTGQGTFDLSIVPPPQPCTPLDDGTTENLLGWTAGGDMVWLNRFGQPGIPSQISSIDVAWGSALYPNYNPGNGTATHVFLYQDGTSQDGDPSDATLLVSIPTTVSAVDTDTYVNYPITPVSITGYFFVGSQQAHFAGQYVATMDQSVHLYSDLSWFFGDNTSPLANYTNPGANVQPPYTFDSIGYPAYTLCRVSCNTGPATYLCDPGSGPTMACPCSNPPSGTGKGCDNSAATGGASITGAGNNSLATPTLAFTTAGERPSATSIVLQGTVVNTTGLVFGQGVRCAAGVLKRLYVKTAVGGSITAPNLAGGDLDIPTRSGNLGDPITAGQNRWYLVYYRDPIVLGGCSSLATFNATNTAAVLWQP